jgi:nitrogen regulatory protein PII
MKILTDLANLLTENDKSITTSLLKIKVLASRLKNYNLYNWINKELSGYQTKEELPKYRISGCNLIGDFQNRGFLVQKQTLATFGLPDFEKEFVSNIEFYQSISVLESYLKTKGTKSLKYPVPTEMLGDLSANYHKMGNHDLTIINAHKEVGIGAVEQILAEVRNFALDMILKLEAEFGYQIDLEELIQKKQQVNNTIQNIMNQTNITNNGDGNVVNTGNDSNLNIDITVKKNDFDSVREQLLENNIEEIDIDSLKEVISENPDFDKKVFGPKVNNWIQKMTGKALAGTWNIGIGASAGILVEIIKKYYGM